MTTNGEDGYLPGDDSLDPRFRPAVEMIGRTGAVHFQMRYCEEEQPAVWLALAVYAEDRFEVAAGHGPVEATFRLCDQIIDGGTCTWCLRPTGFVADLNPMPGEEWVCWFQWDPELATFRRGCEGDDRYAR